MPEHNCIFCKIVAGDVPCHRVYDDDRVLAFLDIGPLARGHTLVIPKAHAVTLGDLADDDAAAIGRVLPRLVRAVGQATGVEPCNVLQNNGAEAGQAVMHVHFHIIPRPPQSASGGAGLRFEWSPGELDDASLAEAIRVQLAP
jgi:histidine triad (HIT) family protein